MRLIYSLFVLIFGLVLKLMSFFNGRIRKWNNDRVAYFQSFDKVCQSFGNSLKIWIHCASLGEYEQGLPIIRALKEKYPECKILLTFFSPSGFENKRQSQLIDHVMYLPLDTMQNARKFVNVLKPNLYIGVKYEFWWNSLKALKDNGCHMIFISVVVPKNVYFLKKWLPFQQWIKDIDYIFTQDNKSKEYLLDIDYRKVSVAGDTRVLSVVQRRQEVKSISYIEQYLKRDKKVLILGSIYMSDLRAIVGDGMGQYFCIVVPHNVSPENIDDITRFLGEGFVLCSQLNVGSKCTKGIIVDSIGLLFSLYQYADCVYIGGGFEKSIHNTLEPAVFGIPVAFGPRFRSFGEAFDFIENGIGQCIENKETFKAFLDYSTLQEVRDKIKLESKAYFEQHSESVSMIMEYLSFLSN